MSESIKRYCESAKNKMARCVDVARVGFDMGVFKCGPDFVTAMEECDPDWRTRGAEVSIESCVEATAALRRCMQGNPDAFREHIAAMDEGMVEDERLRREPAGVVVYDGPSWR